MLLNLTHRALKLILNLEKYVSWCTDTLILLPNPTFNANIHSTTFSCISNFFFCSVYKPPVGVVTLTSKCPTCHFRQGSATRSMFQLALILFVYRNTLKPHSANLFTALHNTRYIVAATRLIHVASVNPSFSWE